MYRRILVALDGSEVAERILPHVEALAEKFGSALTLLRATPGMGEVVAATGAGGGPMDGEVVDPTPIIEAERQEAAAYLDAAAADLRGKGLTVDCDQPEGPAGELVVERARRLGADLIAMTTHGRGGLERLVFGSVADAVLRNAPCPVLLVRVSETRRVAPDVPVI
jgi:nucleotide-binding universal stress UspA family protein